VRKLLISKSVIILARDKGVRLDRQCAMCYWGLYKAEAFRGKSSKQFADDALAKAASLKGHVSKAERLYIEASMAHEEAENSEKKSDTASETKEMQLLRKLVKRSPHDTQARIFLAWALVDDYDDAGEPHAGQKEALSILQSVLTEEPENSAANHYWIHAVEPSAKPERALRSAEMLARLAPTSGHMVHMPGHIFYRTGDYAQAKVSFAASMQADEHYMQAQHVEVDNDWNYAHNLMYAIANLMEQGQMNEATELSRKLTAARGQLECTLYAWSARDGISRLHPLLPMALRTGAWGQVLELLNNTQATASLPNLVFLARELTDFATGMHALDAHDLGKAEEASARLDVELWRISQRLKDEEAVKDAKKEKEKIDQIKPTLKVMPDALPQPLVDTFAIMSLELRAAVLVAKKQMEEAKKLFAQATQEERALGYHEPPGYIRPVAETEAAALLMGEDWAGAKTAYQRSLVERPLSGFAHYGCAFSTERAGDVKAAAVEYAKFLTAWKNADAGLVELAHAREYLAQHGEVGSGE
jgi:tetratricopeptide (TPR) repeat protein